MSSSRHDESSMSSLSAGMSAYNAAEPKPLAGGASSSQNSAAPSKSHMSSSSNRGPPPPPPPRSASSSRGSRSNGGGGGGASRGGSRDRPAPDDDERSSATSRLLGLVNELTGSNDDGGDHRSSSRGGGGGGGGGGSRPFDYYDEHDGVGGYYDDDRGRGGGRGSSSSSSRRGGGASTYREDADDSRYAGAPAPLSSHRGSSSNNSRREPDGVSHEFGADDPEGRRYAPGGGGGYNGGGAREYRGGRGGRSVASSRNGGGGGGRAGAIPPAAMTREEGGGASYYSGRSVRSSGGGDSSHGGGGGGSRYERRQKGDDEGTMGEDGEEGSIPEQGSYYSRESRDSSSSRGSKSTRGNGRKDIVSYAKNGGGDDDDDRSSSQASKSTTKKNNGGGKGKNANVTGGAKNKRAMWWYNFSRCVTMCVPDACIRKEDAEAKQAWREKVAICFCVFVASVFFVGAFGFIPILLCRERTVYTLPDVQERVDENWIVLNGYVYDVTGLFDRHPTGPAGIEAFLHDDASRLFPRLPPAVLPDYCINPSKFDSNVELQSTVPACSDFTEEDLKNGLPCHDFVAGINATAKYMGEFEKGVRAHDEQELTNSAFTFWVSIHDRVYNVTEYVNDIRNEQTKQIEKDHPLAYLEQKLNNLVINKLNEDATELFDSLFPDDKLLGCMDELFFVGIIDTRFDVVCFILNIIMYFLLAFVAVIMVAQMLCSLMYVAKGTRTYTDEDTQDQVIIMVPCYNEGGKELIKTIDSVLATTYPEENKVIFIIADGVVTGQGQDLSTPEHLAEILGFEMDPQNDELYDYGSIGLLTSNRARVYHGYYEVEDRSLKYLVVVKHGLPMEQTGSAKPGNRGKRDSQLIIMGYFNRVYHGRELTELDAAIEDALIDLNMQSDDMRLLMTIDADTRVEELSVTHMTYAMNQNDRILALCGETKVDNKWQSWVTMMQVFEYYNNHHMKKAFESAFGCVTCLPGCFTMYRILNDDGKPLLADDHVYAEYLRNDIDSLHEQNLFHLGEDRMLTTLLLHFFSGMFLSYVPEAQCFTIVPHSMRILLSQRRRWINSTYHNLLELTKVQTMCGVCCCSMKTVVYLDLIACMILPASTVYAVYLIFLVAAGKTQFSLLLLVLYGLIIGVQIIVFVLRSRYDFLFWFIYFTIVGVPVFYFVLPLYAFWHMDDFSWGETRKVAAMKDSFQKPQQRVEDDDDDESTESDDESEGYSRSRRTIR